VPTLPFSCASLPLTSADFDAALTRLNVDAATAWTILNVESGKAGYLADRRPQILYERAIFHRQTQGAFDTSHPGISAPTGGGYVGGAAEYTRLAEAYALAPEAALRSASWGIGQIMGFNFAVAGLSSATELVEAACGSEAAQLMHFVGFLEHNQLVGPLQAHDWVSVATTYNGSGNVAVYSQKLTDSFAALQIPGRLPDLDVRTAQLYLRFLSSANNTPAWNPSNIDGVWGPHTQAALNAFQTAQGIDNTTAVDDGVLASLAAALPAAVDLDIS
jgi:hypothetical protein